MGIEWKGYKHWFDIPKDFKLPFKCTGIERAEFYNLFRKYEVDYREVDYYALLDPSLSYHENKQILEEYLQRLTGKRAEVMYPWELKRELQRYEAMEKEWHKEMQRRGEAWISAL